MRFSLSALQFGKELLEVKSNAEEKQFGRDIGSPSHQEAPEVPQAGRWLHTPVHVHLLKYFRLLAGSAVDICRPFLYTVLVVSVFSQPQFTTKNEIGNPFRGSLSHFFRWGYFATAPFLFALFYFLRVGNIFFFTCFRLSAPLPQQAAV